MRAAIGAIVLVVALVLVLGGVLLMSGVGFHDIARSARFLVGLAIAVLAIPVGVLGWALVRATR